MKLGRNAVRDRAHQERAVARRLAMMRQASNDRVARALHEENERRANPFADVMELTVSEYFELNGGV